MIFKIFSPKNFAKKSAFLTQKKLNFEKKLIITLVFKKNANFFAENWEKSQKIVIITSTPGHPDCRSICAGNGFSSCLECQKNVCKKGIRANSVQRAKLKRRAGLPDFSRHDIPKRGKIYQNDHNITKWP
jgi:hypothetical protein